MKATPDSVFSVRRLTAGALCLAVSALLTACSGATDAGTGDGRVASREPDAREQVPNWKDGVTPAFVSRQMHVVIPGGATDRRAAYQNGFQDDGLLLAFTLRTTQVDALVTQLAPEHELTHRAKPLRHSVKPMTPFAHLGLDEPETLGNVRSGPVCAPCAGELNSLEVTVQPLDARTSRVYLRGVD